MSDTEGKKNEFDRLPAIIETTGFRKTTDDFTFLLATPKRYEEYVKTLMGKLSNFGVFFFIHCLPEQAEALLNNGIEPSVPGIGNPDPQVMEVWPVGVEALAEWLTPENFPVMTERNVQILEAKGVVIRISRGKYDLKRSVRRRIGELSDKGEGKDSDLHREKVEGMRWKRQMREAEYLEKIGKLVNADSVRKAIETAKAAERQTLLNMPKNLVPRLEGLSLTEMEIIVTDWVYKYLATQAAIDLSTAGHQDNATPKKQEKKKRKKREKTK